jgi:transketolase
MHMPTIKPIDEKAIINSAKTTGKIITIEEHSVIGGLGSAVAEIIAEKQPAQLKRLGIMDRFAESGEPEELFEKYGISENHVYNAAKSILKDKSKIKSQKSKVKRKKK